MEYPCPVCGIANSTWFPDVPCTNRKCCKVCEAQDFHAVGVAHDDRKLHLAMLEIGKHLWSFHRRQNPKSHTGNGAPKGAFAFTLTKSPTDDLSEEGMVIAVRKLMAQKSCPVEKYAWYLEYGNEEDKTHPHIHGMYETISQGRIEAKHFKRAWPIWDEKSRCGAGFRGGYHRPVKLDEAYSQYIAKSNGQHDTNIGTE